ncbi:MAG: S1C family serine protease [Halobellus sp.]|uniref:S1C family serine protease n=1 Tax=Halobellus sp. TaxID=1979212 RepID=UPI0035D48053
MVRTGRGQGTGFQYDQTHIITNAHVVGNARTAQLRYNDATWSTGTVRGTDVYSDLAVAASDGVPDDARPLSFVEESPEIGQRVAVIGNPYGLSGTVTSGIVSGTDRLIPSLAGYQIPDAIQTDAAVTPGNSGGPLMSLDGTVVGVVNSKRGDDIAFGISAALTRRVVPALIPTGQYEHAYMCVSLRNVTPRIAQANDLTHPRGSLVVQVADDGPAKGVLQPSSIETVDGIQPPVGGDVITALDGARTQSFEDPASHLALATRPGDTISVTVLRDGARRTVDTTPASCPKQSTSPLN